MIGFDKWSNKESWKKERRAFIVQIVLNHSSNTAFIEFDFCTGFMVNDILKLLLFMTCLVLAVASMCSNEPKICYTYFAYKTKSLKLEGGGDGGAYWSFHLIFSSVLFSTTLNVRGGPVFLAFVGYLCPRIWIPTNA